MEMGDQPGPKPTISIAGWQGCSFHQRALTFGQGLAEEGRIARVHEETFASRDQFNDWLKRDASSLPGVSDDSSALAHRTSPFVWSDKTFIGGCDDLHELVAAQDDYGGASSPVRIELAAKGEGKRGKRSERSQIMCIGTLLPTSLPALVGS